MAQWEFEKNQHSFLAHILIKALTVLARKSPDIEKAFFAQRKVPEGPRPYDIVLTVDGFELPLEAAFEEIARQMDEMVKLEALDLLEERLGKDIDNRVSVLQELITEATSSLRDELDAKLNINLAYDDDGWRKVDRDE